MQGGGTDPWETGSYDLALEEAKIEDFNVVAYTSVIPAGKYSSPVSWLQFGHVSCVVIENCLLSVEKTQSKRNIVLAEATEVKYEDVKHTFHHGECLGALLLYRFCHSVGCS